VNKNKIIEGIYNDKQYLNYCKQVCRFGDLYDDLFQYMILYLLEKPEEELLRLYNSGGLRMYVARLIYINSKSETAPFYNLYIKNKEVNPLELDNVSSEETAEKEMLIIRVSKEIEKEVRECIAMNKYPSAAKLFEVYVEKGSYQSVVNEFKDKGIPLKYKTVRRLISEFKTKIKNNIK